MKGKQNLLARLYYSWWNSPNLWARRSVWRHEFIDEDVMMVLVNCLWTEKLKKTFHSEKKTYTPEMMMLVFQIFSTSRKSFEIVRQHFILPHKRSLRNISLNFTMTTGLNISPLNHEYLQKTEMLLSEQRIINLIHISSKFTNFICK